MALATPIIRREGVSLAIVPPVENLKNDGGFARYEPA